MRFLNVDHVKRDPIAVTIVESIERGNLPAKWRSSIAAEYQHDRLLAHHGRKGNYPASIQCGK